MLCAPLDWQYAELPSSASDAVLCSVLVRKMSNQIEKEKRKSKFDLKYIVEKIILFVFKGELTSKNFS